MKKKIISLCLIIALAVTAIVGASLAYFTDTDEADNVFTAGSVKIKLIEQERKTNTDGSVVLSSFTDEKALYPIVGSAQGAKDKYGLPTAKNYVDKIVTVQNLASDAYVRVYVAVPSALVNTSDASKDILHWNWGNKFTAAGNYDTTASPQPTSADYTQYMGSVVMLSGTTNIGGESYYVYYQTYNKKLAKNDITGSAFMVGMYLDKDVDTRIGTQGETIYTVTRNNVTTDIDFDLSEVTIPVFAVGAQASGFSSADEAINAAFGANYNPWG